jgi:hypothetical protein
MANWQKASRLEPPKTKAELREMLTEAVRNTQRRTTRRSAWQKPKREREPGG